MSGCVLFMGYVIGRKMRNRNQLTAAFIAENCNDTLAKDSSMEMLFA